MPPEVFNPSPTWRGDQNVLGGAFGGIDWWSAGGGGRRGRGHGSRDGQ